MSNVFDGLIEKARHTGKKIVLTESEDQRIIEAAKKAAGLDLCKVMLLVKNEDVKSNFSEEELNNIEIIDISVENEKTNEYIDTLYELRKEKGMTEELAHKQVTSDKLVYAMLMLRLGDADGVVSGAINHTADVLRPSLQILKTAAGQKLVSGFFIMDVPDCKLGQGGTFLFADCGLNQDPNAEELAAIADSSAKSFKQLVGAKPIVAMLSHSTKGSAKHPLVDKVTEATRIAHELYPGLAVDGELQADAALVPSIAKSKAPGSDVAGKANVLIFPNLDSGNIGYKLVQRLGRAEAYGPMIQGMAKPINDLSRGCSWQDIVGVVALTAVQAQLV